MNIFDKEHLPCLGPAPPCLQDKLKVGSELPACKGIHETK